MKGSGVKPRGSILNRLASQVKVFGKSREAFLQKGSLAAGGAQESVADLSKAPYLSVVEAQKKLLTTADSKALVNQPS